MGFSYVYVGCGFWAATHDNWAKAIRKIVLKGGDADANALVAGAYLGCNVRFDALSQHLVISLSNFMLN